MPPKSLTYNKCVRLSESMMNRPLPPLPEYTNESTEEHQIPTQTSTMATNGSLRIPSPEIGHHLIPDDFQRDWQIQLELHTQTHQGQRQCRFASCFRKFQLMAQFKNHLLRNHFRFANSKLNKDPKLRKPRLVGYCDCGFRCTLKRWFTSHLCNPNLCTLWHGALFEALR